jgi:transposase
MFSLGPATRIYLAAGPTDLRLGYDGLSVRTQHVLAADPMSGHLFVFCNRTKNRIKLLYWDGSGQWLCSKRLHAGRYSWPALVEGQSRVSLRAEELALLLGGIELERTRAKEWWRREPG